MKFFIILIFTVFCVNFATALADDILCFNGIKQYEFELYYSGVHREFASNAIEPLGSRELDSEPTSFEEVPQIYKATYLIRVLKKGEKETAKRLILSGGTDVNAVDSNGVTALIIASAEGYLEIAELLILNGADVNTVANAKNWEISLFDDYPTGGRTALMLASGEGHIEIVELLISNGADLNATNSDGATALMYASRAGQTEIVEL